MEKKPIIITEELREQLPAWQIELLEYYNSKFENLPKTEQK